MFHDNPYTVAPIPPYKIGKMCIRDRRKRQPIEDYMELQTHLARYFDTKVDLKRNEQGRGKIVISFKSDSDLERIVELLDKVDKK